MMTPTFRADLSDQQVFSLAAKIEQAQRDEMPTIRACLGHARWDIQAMQGAPERLRVLLERARREIDAATDLLIANRPEAQ